MSKFELFCLIYYALEKYSQERPVEERNNFLSGMSPFTFSDLGSADPEIYEEFIQKFGNDPINIDISYSIAKEYVLSINIKSISEAFSRVTEEIWMEAVTKYLASNHKGK